MSGKHKSDFETKVNLVKRYLSGQIGVNEAAREVGIDPASVRNWISKYESKGLEAFLPRERNNI